jgi:hypothetical protein
MIKAVTKQILKKNPKMDNCEEAVTSSVFVFWAFTYQKWAGVICFDNTE